MFFDEYQNEARRYQKPGLSTDARLLHAASGLCAEAGECAAIWQKAIQGEEEFDDRHAMREAGDMLWFCAEIADCFQADLMDFVEEYDMDEFAKKNSPEFFNSAMSDSRYSPFFLCAMAGLTAERCAMLARMKDTICGDKDLLHLFVEEVMPDLMNCLRYLGVHCAANDWKFSEVAEENLRKLEARYPENRYVKKDSLNREPEDV